VEIFHHLINDEGHKQFHFTSLSADVFPPAGG